MVHGNIYKAIEEISKFKIVKKRSRREIISYYNCAVGMDIEDSNFITERGEKASLMYIHEWMFDHVNVYGRTWDDFREIMDTLNKELDLSYDKRLVIYIHNLGHEFQFMRKEIPIDSVFAVKDRTPVKVLSGGIEFRDSLILTGKSLYEVGIEVGIPKLKGDLDYDLIRTPETPMTAEEMGYCYNDVDILGELIRMKIDEDGDITKIPMTKTGYVRNYVRKWCYSKKYYSEYRKLMEYLTITPDEYRSLKAAFMGGFTHANAEYAGETITELMHSYDFTSSYTAAMLSEKYPMTKARRAYPKTTKQLENLFKKYLCVFTVQMKDVRMKDNVYENPIPASKCFNLSASHIKNNGRIVYAESLCTTITSVDYEIYRKFYDFEISNIAKVFCYGMGYLPKPIVECALHFYESKTTLKGIEGQEKEYTLLKGMLNSIYGMMVTDIVRDEIIYNEDWNVLEANLEEQVETYNESKSRFLFYPWGVFITAYARKNILNGVYEAKKNYVYTDTDSLKIKHPELLIPFIEKYNSDITEKIRECLKYHKIEYVIPKDKDGIEHPLGVWDFDGEYRKFKTLGAKRYIAESWNGKHKRWDNVFTVSGIRKKNGIDKLTENGKHPMDFEAFNDGLELNEEESGKLCHTYIDEPRIGYIRDYMGKEYEYDIKTCVHLGKTTAAITMSEEYENYILGLKKYKTV